MRIDGCLGLGLTVESDRNSPFDDLAHLDRDDFLTRLLEESPDLILGILGIVERDEEPFRSLRPDHCRLKLRQGGGGKAEAEAIAWVEDLVGDLHQPLRMDARLRGGSLFHVSYRGIKACDDFTKKDPKFNLLKVWDDCLVEELAAGRDPKTLAKDLLGDIKTYKGRPELGHASRHPWLAWGTESHALAVSVAFDHLQEGADLEDAYILGDGNGALSIVRHQLLLAGIRLAFLLDQNFGKP